MLRRRVRGDASAYHSHPQPDTDMLAQCQAALTAWVTKSRRALKDFLVKTGHWIDGSFSSPRMLIANMQLCQGAFFWLFPGDSMPPEIALNQ